MLRCLAAGSSALRPVLEAPARPADCLGVTRGALYLRIAGPPGVLAVLTHDAVRLPCGLVLPTTSAELPLTSLAPAHSMILESYTCGNMHNSPGSWGIVIGSGEVRWSGPDGPVVVRAVREWAPARPVRGEVAASALAEVRSVLGRAGLSGSGLSCSGLSGTALNAAGTNGADAVVSSWLAELGAAACDQGAATAAAMRLLGSGPGLTPSGDDVLAGFLAGAAAFGIGAAALREAVAVLAPARTTALSAALLWHAARGECIHELAGLAAVLTGQGCSQPGEAGRAVSRLVSVGHTSGAALALGLVSAAECALAETGLAETGLAGTALGGTALAGTGPAGTGLAETGLAETVLAETGRTATGDAA
jgi:hypothetical protein